MWPHAIPFVTQTKFLKEKNLASFFVFAKFEQLKHDGGVGVAGPLLEFDKPGHRGCRERGSRRGGSGKGGVRGGRG